MKGNSDWFSELPSTIKKYDNTIHKSIKMTSTQGYRKSNEKLLFSTLADKRQKQTPKNQLGQLVRSADIKRVFSKGYSTNWSYKVYTITEVIHDTIPSYRYDYLLERFNQNLLLSTNLTVDEKNKVMKEQN